MKKRILIVLFAVIALAVIGFAYLQYGWVFYRYHSAACKERGKAYAARVEKLKREAHERLRIGTPKDDVIRFFHENGLPVSLDGDEYEGTDLHGGLCPRWLRL